MVRQRDDDWMMIVKWTLYAMINAEELGITSKNIDEALKSKKPDVMRLVGTEGTYGEDLGLHQGLGRPHHPPCRQLRRGLRAQCRRRIEAEDPARAELALEQRRHPVRAADTVRHSLRGPSFEARCART